MSQCLPSTIDVAPSYLQDRVKPDAPGASWPDGRDWYAAYQLGLREAAGDVVVTHHTALTYSVVWRCVSYIGSTIASLCWHVYERADDGRTRLPVEDNIAWTLEMQASPEMSAFDWRQVMLRDALLWGNGVSEIERNGAGKPLWLHRIDPARVLLDRDQSGRLVYRVRDPNGGAGSVLDPANVFHLKGLSPDGLVGYSVIAMMRRAIELGMLEERYGTMAFRQGPTPGGFLKAPGQMKEDERRAMSQSFSERFGGARNAGKVPVLSGGLEFVPFKMPAEDAQWIEGRNLQAEEVCRAYGVPPHKAGVLTHSTNNNIEHQAIEAVQDCLLPWCRRLETEADLKLFGRVVMGRRCTKLDLKTLLRGDSKTHTENLARQVQAGMATPNEAREEMDRNPEEGGDVLLVQGAMAPLERVLEAPAPAPKPEPAAPAAEQYSARAIARLLAAVRAEWDEEKHERDRGGRFGSGDGEGGGEGEQDPEEAAREVEDERVADQREQEDEAIDAAREKEDGRTEAEREKEDAKVQKARDKEDARIEKEADKLEEKRGMEDDDHEEAKGKEEDKDNAKREKEDDKIQAARDKGDARIEKEQEKEDAKVAGDREKEDGRDGPPDAARQEQRDNEDGEREYQREQANHARVDERQAEDDATQERRDQEDAEREAKWAKVAAEREAAREEEDARMEEEATERENARLAEDEARQARRDAEDEELRLQREGEDDATEARRQAEDREREKQRKEADVQRKGGQEKPKDAALPDALRNVYAPLLADAYARLLRVESDKARRAQNKGRLKEWAAGYYGEGSRTHVAAAVRPAVAAFVKAADNLGWEVVDVDRLAGRLAEDHVRASREWAEQGNATPPAGRAADQVARHLNLIWGEHK